MVSSCAQMTQLLTVSYALMLLRIYSDAHQVTAFLTTSPALKLSIVILSRCLDPIMCLN